MYELTVIISTLNTGILNLHKTVKIINPKINYLIIHQNLDKIPTPSFLKRDDITIIDSPTKGLSKSRNIGLRNCKTNYAIIADDDIEYIDDAIIKLLEIIQTEKPDFATFKIKTRDNEPEFKDYLLEKHSYNKHRLSVASIEILLNIKLIQKKRIAFDERFGLGTKLRQGEEEIFVQDLINNGFHGTYYPIYLVNHPYESTGSKPIKESQKYFLKGAFSQRLGEEIIIPRFDSIIRFWKNYMCFYFGKFYISSTKRSRL